MSRILLCWELGAGYGHIGRLASLAHALARRGHEPMLALRDLSAAEPFLEPGTFKLFQSPLWLSNVGGLPAPENHAEILLRFGFYDATALAAVAYGWRNLVAATRPDLMIFDHAPTALLATRGMRIPRALYGDGFCIPPSTDPWPALRWWQPPTPVRLADATQRVLAIANSTLRKLGVEPLDRLSQLYAAEESFLLTSPALDHYPQRAPCRYWGPVFVTGRGGTPHWPLAGNGRLFVYVAPSAPCFGALLQALQQCGASTLVFAPGISARAAREASSATVTISATPFDMERIRRECDFAVTQSGAGTAAALLLAGKPQLLVPAYTERMMLAKRIEQLGAAIVLAPEQPKLDFRKALKRLLTDATLAQSARSVAAAASTDADAAHGVTAIAERAEALLSAREAAVDQVGTR